MRIAPSLMAAFLLLCPAGGAWAGPVPYPNPGTIAPTVPMAGTGSEVFAYFGGTGAAFSEQVGLYVNGVLTSAGFVFPNQNTAIGTKIDLGFAPAGANVVFALQVFDYILGDNPTGTTTAGTGNLHYTGTPSYTLYSVPSDSGVGPGGPYQFANSDGSNHAYVTPYASGQIAGINVTGTYVGFEDLLTNGASGIPSDLNYMDEQFVFQGVTTSLVPEPSSLVLSGIAGLFVLAVARSRRPGRGPIARP